MTNPDETTRSDITETGPDTIEARGSDGEIISGMTWGEFEENWTKHRISRSIGNATPWSQ
jgi:hypothetical protein